MDTEEIINVHAAKPHLSRLLDRAHAGQEIIIAKAGKPYAQLGPLERTEKRQLGFVDVPISDAFFENLPEDEIAAWE